MNFFDVNFDLLVGVELLDENFLDTSPVLFNLNWISELDVLDFLLETSDVFLFLLMFASLLEFRLLLLGLLWSLDSLVRTLCLLGFHIINSDKLIFCCLFLLLLSLLVLVLVRVRVGSLILSLVVVESVVISLLSLLS